MSNLVHKVPLSFGEGRGEEKTFVFKTHDFSNLKLKLRKGQKKALRKLELVNKGGTFAPATTQTF
ncbi:hypothetical protein, partial [Flavobacterium sp. W22_SRS_FP1]|uniref:hypothetical protein n=1 Tax=Flavobacterium sp. W22_SRS_FP1 TaxID=3240276 RepID=UPI003F8E37FC